MATTVATISNRSNLVQGSARAVMFEYTHSTGADNLLETGLSRVGNAKFLDTAGQSQSALVTLNSKTPGTAGLNPGWISVTAASLGNNEKYVVYAEGH